MARRLETVAGPSFFAARSLAAVRIPFGQRRPPSAAPLGRTILVETVAPTLDHWRAHWMAVERVEQLLIDVTNALSAAGAP